MNLLIIFSIVFAVIVFSIILQRIIKCPLLVGFAFFAVFLVVSAVLNNITYMIGAILLGILAFIVSVLECIARNSEFFSNNTCLRCNNNSENGSNGSNNNDETLRIVNSDGVVVARCGNCIRSTRCR